MSRKINDRDEISGISTRCRAFDAYIYIYRKSDMMFYSFLSISPLLRKLNRACTAWKPAKRDYKLYICEVMTTVRAYSCSSVVLTEYIYYITRNPATPPKSLFYIYENR